MLVVRFEEQITTIQTVKEVVRTTQEGELDIGTQVRKTKQDQNLTLPTITKNLDDTIPNSRGI